MPATPMLKAAAAPGLGSREEAASDLAARMRTHPALTRGSPAAAKLGVAFSAAPGSWRQSPRPPRQEVGVEPEGKPRFRFPHPLPCLPPHQTPKSRADDGSHQREPEVPAPPPGEGEWATKEQWLQHRTAGLRQEGPWPDPSSAPTQQNPTQNA